MTNREKLLRENTCDRLCRAQENLKAQVGDGIAVCILDAIDGKCRTCGLIGCTECIQKWMGEEA